MGTIKVGEVVTRVSRLLVDESGISWTQDDLIDYLNDGIKELIVVKPDASTITESLLLVQGTKQTVPAGRYQLIDVTRNMGLNGSTPGRAITSIAIEELDNEDPDWHLASNEKAVVEHYIYNRHSDRKCFYVYPPQPSAPEQVEIVASAIPDGKLDLQDTLPVDDIYVPALRNYMMSVAYAKDAKDITHQAKSISFYNMFAQLTGAQKVTERQRNPNKQVMPDGPNFA